MSARPPRAPARLQRSTSRTRTAGQALATITVESVSGVFGITELFAGAAEPAASVPGFPGLEVAPPLTDRAVGLRVRATRPDAIVVLTLDLGADTDLARLELWGNPLLAAAAPGGHPDANLGLPRTLAALSQETPAWVTNRRGRIEPSHFPSALELLDDWDLRRLLRDLRGSWGWTPLTLPATFGRRLMLVMTDLPRLWIDGAGNDVHGVDLARIVAYKFLQGSDHGPHVEYAPVGSWQESYAVPSAYWAAFGVAAADPRVHQSLLLDTGTGALLTPGALAGAPAYSDAVGEVAFYASDLLSPAGERAWLVVETGTDEVPLVEALRLTFRRPPDAKKGYDGPKLPYLPDYRIRIDATDDREAAHSSDWHHPAWRPVAAEQRVFGSIVRESRVHLVEPTHARWFRITARPIFRNGVNVAGLPFLLHRLDLLRPRDWTIAPAPDEDVQVETVLLRLRGRDLVSDYAFLDGEHGTEVAVEVMRDGRAWEEVRAFRTLTDLIENLATRVFQNARRVDKPVQRLEEETRATSRVSVTAKTTTKSDTTVSIDPAYGNYTRTRAASFTRYDDEPITGLIAAGLTTTRTFAGDLADIVPPVPDLTTLNPLQLQQLYTDYAAELINQGLPVSLGIGGNVGGNAGGSAIIQGGVNLGVGINVGTQVGGGVTKSVIEGSQGTVVDARSATLEARNRQRADSRQSSSAKQRSTSRDEREILRRDRSEEVRRHGMEVRYGGAYEDLVLAAIPVGVLLRGSPDRGLAADGVTAVPIASRDRVRVRVAHLPPGVVLDVEFRGRRIPRDGGG